MPVLHVLPQAPKLLIPYVYPPSPPTPSNPPISSFSAARLSIAMRLTSSHASAGAPLSSVSNDALLAVLELHILPPVPKLLAPWTTPFFASNPSLTTWLGGSNTLTPARATTG